MTYGALKTRIANEIADSTLSAEIILAIESAIKFYERKEFWFNSKTGTFVTVADQEYYGSAANTDIPTLVKIASPIKVTSSGYKYDVCIVPFADIDAAQDGTRTGRPENAAYFNEQIRLYPIPDAVYTVTMAYQYRLTDLSADADENAWTDDAEELIRQRAKMILAADVLRDVDMYNAAKEFERDAYKALKEETRARRSVSLLRTDLPSNSRYSIYTDS